MSRRARIRVAVAGAIGGAALLIAALAFAREPAGSVDDAPRHQRPGTQRVSDDAGSSAPRRFRLALARHGCTFPPVSRADRQRTRVTPPQARATGRRLSGYSRVPKSEVSVYLGRLTNQGDAHRRLAYAVRIAGPDIVELPNGGFTSSSQGAPLDTADAHHEIVVFVDAVSGKGIVSTTFR